jgi:predicted RNase H-like HicB family nuclease
VNATLSYDIKLFYSAEDGGYIADVPALKSCSAFGATPKEALAEIAEAMEAWLETAEAHEKPVLELV